MRKKRHVKELLICALVCLIPVFLGVSHVQHFKYIESLFVENEDKLIASRSLNNGVEVVEVKEFLEEIAGGKYYMTHYHVPNGDTVVSGSLRGSTNEAVVLQSLHIKGAAQIHYYDHGEFGVYDLSEGRYDSSLIFIDSTEFDIACYKPMQYKMIENEALEYIPDADGYLNVKKTSDGFDLELFTGEVGEDCCTDFMLVYSEEDIMDWSTNTVDKEWLSFTMDGNNRWTYTGYYRISPETYYPTGENVFYRCQACYLGNSFAIASPRYRVMDDMLLCILDTMQRQQNQMGFFPSTSRSNWLYEDYNINAYYYDTRFNSDLMEIFIMGYDLYLNSACYQAMEKYADFFEKLAQKISREDGNGGIWMPDYWGEGGNIDAVHTSLNHQLSEISVLYKLSEILKRKDLEDLANKMLKAIENSAAAWIKDNSDLHYCINTDGSYGRDDYPDLTYKDLYKMQLLLEKKYGKRNEVLDRLLNAKKRWMINNNINTNLF